MIRSYLFVPANRPERYAKALAAGADALIIDLEDAVPLAEKNSARTALANWFAGADAVREDVYVRLNAPGTPWYDDDVAMCRAARVKGVMPAKSERASDIGALAQVLGNDVVILPLIESALGFANAAAIAAVPQVGRLVFGTIDFQLDLGLEGEDLELLYFRSQLSLLSRLAGLPGPVDGVTTTVDDVERIRADTLRGKRLGFTAKLCIHPKQVAAVHAAYAPTAEEVEWAGRVLAAAEAAHGGAFALDGKMVDRPVILKAEKIRALSA